MSAVVSAGVSLVKRLTSEWSSSCELWTPSVQPHDTADVRLDALKKRLLCALFDPDVSPTVLLSGPFGHSSYLCDGKHFNWPEADLHLSKSELY